MLKYADILRSNLWLINWIGVERIITTQYHT